MKKEKKVSSFQSGSRWQFSFCLSLISNFSFQIKDLNIEPGGGKGLSIARVSDLV